MRRWIAAVVVLALVAFVPVPFTAEAAGGISMVATNESLEVLSSASVNTDWRCSWVDSTTTAFTPGTSSGQITTGTTTTIVAAPAASTQRKVSGCQLYNRGSAAQTITFKWDVGGTERYLWAATLAPGESAHWDEEAGFRVANSSGIWRTQATDISGYSGRAFVYSKPGTAKDAAGYWIAYAKDAGHPGAYALGTPGLNGLATDCSTVGGSGTAEDVGANVLPNAASGSYYLTAANLSSSVAEIDVLADVLWYNTGLAVTTTTGQAVTFPGLPARDINGSTNGEGVYAALLTTTANTNAGVITNTTITYTDSEGNSPNTGTFQGVVGWQAPATPVIGTLMPFQLAAGDRGVRSVQTITLGTSYGAGALSLILYRPLAAIPNPVASVGGIASSPQFFPAPGIRVYNGTCVWAASVGAAGAANLAGTYTIMER